MCETHVQSLYNFRGVPEEPPLLAPQFPRLLGDSGLFPGVSDSKKVLQYERPGFDAWVGRIPREGYLAWESHEQKGLMGGSPQGHKESDTTEPRTLSHFHWSLEK